MLNYFDTHKDIDKIEENLWLVNTFAAGNIKDLKEKGIKKILSVMSVPPNYDNKEYGFNHKKIEIDDMNHQNIIQYFGECLNFIKGDEKVLVHCLGGVSRSPTIVIAYIMWIKKMKYDEAIQFVKSKRSIIGPNSGFIKQLKMFHNILIDNDYNIDKINFKQIKWVP